MSASSYTIQLHILHEDIWRVLTETGSQASVDDVLRALAAKEHVTMDEAVRQVLSEMDETEMGPADPFTIDERKDGHYVAWQERDEKDLGPFRSEDDAVRAGHLAGGRHETDDVPVLIHNRAGWERASDVELDDA